MHSALTHACLYGIIDLGYVSPNYLTRRTEQLLKGGADLIQLRAKGCPVSDVEKWARELLPLCRKAGVPFIVNDYPEIAHAVGSDGVHIGQEDGSLEGVRQIVGDKMIVGRSTHSATQAQAALEEGFDYIGFGPLYATPTKKGRVPIGLHEVKGVEETVGQSIPVFCIGGIKEENLGEVKAAGARRIVIVSDLLMATNPEDKTSSIKATLERG